MPIGLVLIVAGLLSGAGRAAAQPFFDRGDADCSVGVSAADLVAAVRGLGGTSTCGNDDCDRDGMVTAADILCTAGCLFDSCPIPDNAPRVSGVTAESAPTVVPASVVRLSVRNLGSTDKIKRVTVGGFEAEVVDQTDDELAVVLPFEVPVGPADVVVFDGDLAGAPFSIDVAPATPLGAPDTFDGTLALVDGLIAQLLMLDVDSVYGDAAALIREELTRYRSDLVDQRAALANAPELSDADRLQLDAAIDGSGVPELLRQLLVDLAAPASPPGPNRAAAATAPVLAFKRGADTIKIVRGVAQTAAATLSTPAIVAIATGAAIIGGVLLAASDPITPLIFGITYVDASGATRSYPTGGGFATFRGARFDALTTSLGVRATGGYFVSTESMANDDTLTFHLPDTEGFCGRSTLELYRLRSYSNPVPTAVQPELLSLPSTAPFHERISGTARGTTYCFGQALFNGPAAAQVGFSTVGDHGLELNVPRVEPGRYGVGLRVQGVRSDPDDDLTIDVTNALTGMKLSCPSEVEIPEAPADGAAADSMASVCDAVLVPEEAGQPQPSLFVWHASNSKVSLQTPTHTGRSAIVGRGIGAVSVSVALVLAGEDGQQLAASDPVQVAVVDRIKPRITISSTTTSPVQPGGSIDVSISASDNYKLGAIQLTATGDAVASGGDQTSLDCSGKKQCTTTLSVGVKDRDFTTPTITVTASVVDLGVNSATSNMLTFKVARDDHCPTVTIQEPAAGGTVNAGQTVTAVAVARDDQPDDTGVQLFKYSASGPALSAPVSQVLPLPQPQAAPTLRFNFTVKSAAELTDVDDRTITISVEALDAAKPPNSCGAQTTTVSVIGVLDRCEGGITVDHASGYIGDPFTISVALAGDGAASITRVTSINPGGQFDLQPQGGGLYTVTLFYQGTGSFTLRFVAFDATGSERCAGSIGLASLGPKPSADAAAAQGEAGVAGAGLQ